MTWKIQIIYDKGLLQNGQSVFEGKQCVHVDEEKHGEILLAIVFEWWKCGYFCSFETFLYFPNFSENCIWFYKQEYIHFKINM